MMFLIACELALSVNYVTAQTETCIDLYAVKSHIMM